LCRESDGDGTSAMIGRYEMVNQEFLPEDDPSSAWRRVYEEKGEEVRDGETNQFDSDTVPINSSPSSSSHSPSFTSSDDPHSLTSLTTFITIVKCAVGGGSFNWEEFMLRFSSLYSLAIFAFIQLIY
jgi:hypothetical protein